MSKRKQQLASIACGEDGQVNSCAAEPRFIDANLAKPLRSLFLLRTICCSLVVFGGACLSSKEDEKSRRRFKKRGKRDGHVVYR